MHISNFIYTNKAILFMIFIFINILKIIISFESSHLKTNYFNITKRLYYVNAMNNANGDLYFEFWGEQTNYRYFIGLNATTEEDLYIGNDKLFSIEGNSISTHHDSIIIYDNNKKENIFSINNKYFDYINIKEKIITSKKADDLIFQNKGDNPSFKNSIIKLKCNNYYLLSIVLITQTLFVKSHEVTYKIFEFSSNNINGFQQIKNKQKTISFINSTDCFQTESEYIECSFTNVLPSNLFHVGIYDLNMNEKNTISFNYIKDNTFTKIFHIKNEIGAYLYYDDRDQSKPKLHFKELNSAKNNLINVFNFEYIPLNNNGKYSLNTLLFFSDGIKINDSKIVVIMTTQESNLLICILDLFYDKNLVKVRYFEINLAQANIKISINLRAFKFKNYFGLSFYNSNIEYSGYTIFNYPNITSNNKINNRVIEIKIFNDSSIYSFSISENIELINNIYGGEEKIKIINFPDKSSSGIILKSNILNNEISLNDVLDINDIIIFELSNTGAIPGSYILEFSPIIKYTEDKSMSMACNIEYFGNFENIIENQHLTITDDVFKLIYKIECQESQENCEECQLDSDSFFYCIKCKDNLFTYIKNEKCICDFYIFVDEEETQNCIKICDNYKYIINENEKYCLPSCLFNNEELYLDEENSICYKNCSEAENGKKYIFQKKCVAQCPEKYMPDSNNICIFEEVPTQEKVIESSIVDNLNSELIKITSEANPSTIIVDNNFPSTIIEKDSKSSTIIQAENKLSTIIEDNNKLSTIIEEDVKITTIIEDNNNPSTIIEETTYLQPIIEKDNIASTIIEDNNNPSTIIEKDTKLSTNIVTDSKLSTNFDSDMKFSAIIEDNINPSTIIEKDTKFSTNIETDSKFSILVEEVKYPTNIEDNTNLSTMILDNTKSSNIFESEGSINNITINTIKTSAINNLNNFSDISSFYNINSDLETKSLNITFPNIKSSSELENNENNHFINANTLINNFIYNNSELEIEKTQNDTMIYYCYSSKSSLNTLMEINSYLTYVNLKDCEKMLMNENNLQNHSDLLILGIESPSLSKNSSINNFNYEIFTRKGEKINNLTVCDNTDIEISSPIINLNLINYEKAIVLSEQGYDIFNLSSNFYYDYCSSAFINNSDLTLSVRLEDIYPNNISFCQNGCIYKEVDLNNKRFLCLCKADLSKNYEINKENNALVEEVEENFFIYIIDMINYQIIPCYKLLFNINNYFHNYGFYVGLSLNLAIILFSFIYCFCGKKSIKLQYLHYMPKVNDIRNMEKDFNNIYKKNNTKSDIEEIKNFQRFEMRIRKATKRKERTKIGKKKINDFNSPLNPIKKRSSFKSKAKKNSTEKEKEKEKYNYYKK